MMQFCDPEEMEYPDLKKALDAHHIPHVKIGVDQMTRDFGQPRPLWKLSQKACKRIAKEAVA